MSTATYPVVYHQTPAVERSRLTVFFRFIMVIPHLIWSFFYGFAAAIGVFIAWFATMFTGRYHRLTIAFRIVLLIPVMVLLYIFNLWVQAVSIVLWFVAVITGRTSAGLVDAGRFPLAYMMRAYAYAYLLTDGWPPLED
jgi:hypothetical protein